MLFNSLEFALFLPVVFILFWLVLNKSFRAQNLMLLLASYIFYSWWDWRFLLLLVFSTALDYFTGIKVSSSTSTKTKKFWFWLSIIINLGFLGVFKYYNFFVDSLADALGTAGIKTDFWTLNIILPVGISFYTFHGLSYVIDIYYNRIKAEKNFVDYSLFVSFFPLLVAGPIERATHLLPQIKEKRVFDYTKAVDGMRQILWGLFKKIVIADNCASYANEIFSNPAGASGSTLALGAVFFAFQIYGDFSGYSDIARGTARLFGYELLQNFKFPYFSRNIAEFWKRWHISLSSWFRDYLYIPLGGNATGKAQTVRNTFVIFLVSGFWHGASWNFVVWGFLHALFFLPLLLLNKTKTQGVAAQGKPLPSITEIFQIAFTFTLVCFAWIFFRAKDLNESLIYIKGIFSSSLLSKPQTSLIPLFLIGFLMAAEWLQREKTHALQIDAIKYRWMRWTAYLSLCFIILFATKSEVFSFIYFQF